MKSIFALRVQNWNEQDQVIFDTYEAAKAALPDWRHWDDDTYYIEIVEMQANNSKFRDKNTLYTETVEGSDL